MVLVKNLKFFHLFIFGKIREENVFDDILERKRAFLDSKIRKLKKSKNHDFSKKLVHGLVKNLEFFHVFILAKSASKLKKSKNQTCLSARS